MTSAGHHTMMQKAGTPAPPYSSPVAYLQSDGVAYIQFPDVLGISGQLVQSTRLPYFDVEIGIFSFNQTDGGTTGSTTQCLAAFGSSTGRIIQRVLTSATTWGTANFAANLSLTKTTYPTVSTVGMRIADGLPDGGYAGVKTCQILVDGAVMREQTASYASIYLATLRLFAGGGTSADGWTSVSMNNRYGRISFVKMRLGDTLVLDALPYRVDQTGFMYDKISDTFFGNSAATGALLYGDDVGGVS